MTASCFLAAITNGSKSGFILEKLSDEVKPELIQVAPELIVRESTARANRPSKKRGCKLTVAKVYRGGPATRAAGGMETSKPPCLR